MSGVVGYLVRSDARRHWRSFVLLALVAAFVVGTTLTAFAGSRRSQSAFDRYLEEVRTADLITFVNNDAPLDDVAGVESVESAVAFDLLAAIPERSDPSEFFPMFAPYAASTMFRYPLVSGRRADPGEVLEVNLSERTARRLKVATGDELPLVSYTQEEAGALEEEDGGPAEPTGPSLRLRVVGVVRDPGDIVGRTTDISPTFLTPAFTRQYADQIGKLSNGVLVRLAEPKDVAAYAAAIEGQGETDDTTFGEASFRAQATPTMNAIGTGLLAFGVVAGVAGLVVLAQVGARIAQRTAAERSALPAVGVGPRFRRLALALPLAASAAGGVLLGALASVLASPLLPIGLARRAEPDPGIRVDAFVLGIGVVASVLLVATLALAVAIRADREATGRTRSAPVSRLAAVVSRTSAPVPVIAGIQLAVSRGAGSRALPVRAAVAGVMTAVAGVLATAVFSASSHHLRETPQLYGWGWDTMAGGEEQSGLVSNADAVAQRLVADPAFRAVAELWFQLPVTVDGRPMAGLQLTELKGHTGLVVVDGRAPGAREIAVGATTLRSLGKAIGDEIDVQVTDGPTTAARISGVVAFPVDFDGGSSAEGLALTDAAGRSFGFRGDCDEEAYDCNRVYALAWAPGADRAAADARYAAQGIDLERPIPPGELNSLLAVERLPVVLALFLACIGVVAVGYTAAVTVRRRRRDLALLRTLGMTARDLRLVVFSQTSTLAAVGAALGAVAGVAAGRQVWRLTVGSVHLVYFPVVPLAALFVVVAATLVVAHLATTLPRRRLGGLRPAAVLRGE